MPAIENGISMTKIIYTVKKGFDIELREIRDEMDFKSLFHLKLKLSRN